MRRIKLCIDLIQVLLSAIGTACIGWSSHDSWTYGFTLAEKRPVLNVLLYFVHKAHLLYFQHVAVLTSHSMPSKLSR